MIALTISDVSILCSGLVTVWFIIHWHFRREVFLLPGVFAVIGFHIFVQWPSVLAFDFAREWLGGDVVIFYTLTHAVPILYLAVVSALAALPSWRWRLLSDEYATTATGRDDESDLVGRGLVLALWTYSVLALVIYATAVPLSSTPFVVALTDPLGMNEAREEALKLVSSPLVRYTYAIFRATIAPILLTHYVWKLKHARKMTISQIVQSCAAIVFVTAAACMTGERGDILRLALPVLSVVGVRSLRRASAWKMALAVIVFCSYAVALTTIREGRNLTVSEFVLTYQDFVEHRVLEGPTQTGVVHVYFALHHGFTWGRSIGLFSTLTGTPYVDVPNSVGLLMTPLTPIRSVSANSAWIYAFYVDFGLVPAIVLGVASLVMLDAVAAYTFMRYESRRWASLFHGVMLAQCWALTSTALPTSMLSHGIMITVIVALAARSSLRMRGDPLRPIARLSSARN